MIYRQGRSVGSPLAQRTIAAPARVGGFGYWTGCDVVVDFRPAPPDAGVVFVRRDLPGRPRVAARVEHRVDMSRRTDLVQDGVGVSMVEHVMAALFGLEIDNCLVFVDSEEMPGCDGSSSLFVEALVRAGTVLQGVPRRFCAVGQPMRVERDDAWIEAWPSPDGRTRLEYHLDYGPAHPIVSQSFSIDLDASSFRREIARSRTFLTEEEAAWLRAQGLGQRASARDLLVFGQDGLIDNTLRYVDECARHKLLDMVGDLALGGCRPVGHFRASRSGHQLNADMVKCLIENRTGACLHQRCA